MSPGTSSEILNYSNLNNLNFIPGVATPSDIMTAIEYKKTILKFFHAERNGGTSALKFLNEIFENIKFIPTGGITNENALSYLALDNVIAVGASALISSDLVNSKSWSEIKNNLKESKELISKS